MENKKRSSRHKATARQVADYFLSLLQPENGDSITHLKLQKLVYYAQAWHLVFFDKPLYNDRIEAWVHGPVVPDLYRKYRDIYPNDVINIDPNKFDIPEFSKDKKALLNEVYSVYGELSGAHLEELTHSEDPWLFARGNRHPLEKCSEPITLKSMKEYYKTLLNNVTKS